MKKLFLVFSVVGFFALSSCSKEYSCECSNGDSTTIEGKKGDAEDACTAIQATQSIFTPGLTCELN